MAFKYNVIIGIWKEGKYDYLTNFYTTKIASTSHTAIPVSSVAAAKSILDTIDAYKYFSIIVPSDAPNAMHVVKVMNTMVPFNKPILALNLSLQAYTPHKSLYEGDLVQLFLHDVQFLQFAPTPFFDEEGTGDDSIALKFKGVVGPIQKIGNVVMF